MKGNVPLGGSKEEIERIEKFFIFDILNLQNVWENVMHTTIQIHLF